MVYTTYLWWNWGWFMALFYPHSSTSNWIWSDSPSFWHCFASNRCRMGFFTVNFDKTRGRQTPLTRVLEEKDEAWQWDLPWFPGRIWWEIVNVSVNNMLSSKTTTAVIYWYFQAVDPSFDGCGSEKLSSPEMVAKETWNHLKKLWSPQKRQIS